MTQDTQAVAWCDVGEPDDFPDGAVWPVVAEGQPVAVFRQGEELFGLYDLCTHGAAKLSDGWVEDGCVECPLHQGTFDIRTGAPCQAPVTEAVRTFPVRVVAGRVEVGVAFVGAGAGAGAGTLAATAGAAGGCGVCL